MTHKARIAIVGAGLIGVRHAEAITAASRAELCAVADPTAAGAELAKRFGVPGFASLDELIGAGAVDGIILATPNQLHAQGALQCIAAGLPVLVEKPICSTVEDASRIVDAAREAGVALAVGHHRRHNPLIGKARSLIDENQLGTIASVHSMFWLMKPDDYFETDWRRRKGAGPVYINLIHDIDLLCHLCGPVAEVHTMQSNAIRGNEVEDTAVVNLRFASGALGTINICDSAVAPWSWELTARENPAYHATPENCYWIAGTHGSLSLPNLALWKNPDKRSWWEPISATNFPVPRQDPLVRQAEQFAEVILDGEAPLVTGEDGLRALQIVEAIKVSAEQCMTIRLESGGA